MRRDLCWVTQAAQPYIYIYAEKAAEEIHTGLALTELNTYGTNHSGTPYVRYKTTYPPGVTFSHTTLHPDNTGETQPKHLPPA